MANNYLQFSFNIPIPQEDIQRWVERVLNDEDKEEARRIFPEFEEEGEDVGFFWRLSDGTLWIYAEEYGDLDNLAYFLEALLLRPGFTEHQIGFTYALWCSKPRIGEFGGGALLVRRTKDGSTEVIGWDAHDLLHESMEAYG